MTQGYNGKNNYLTGNVLSDEWYTPIEVVRFIKNNNPINIKKYLIGNISILLNITHVNIDIKNNNSAKILKKLIFLFFLSFFLILSL